MNRQLPWVVERMRPFREAAADFARWARGYGPTAHNVVRGLGAPHTVKMAT